MGEPFRVGYCRCSTDEQDVEIQTDQLLALGVPRERIFIDKGFSGTTRRNRSGVDNAVTAVTSAAAAVTDRQVVLTTTKFDRFARNMAEAGKPIRSTGNLSVLQLAAEANVKYWIVAQKHTDLRDHFQRLSVPAKRAATTIRDHDELARLRRDHADLKTHCDGLEQLLEDYAVIIQEVTLENAALREQASSSSTISPLRSRHRRQYVDWDSPRSVET